MKRDGNTVVQSLFTDVLWSNGSASKAAGLMQQIEFNPALAERLKSDPETVVKDLEELRKYLTDPSNLRVAITGNVTGLEEPRSTWKKHYAPVSVSPSSESERTSVCRA